MIDPAGLGRGEVRVIDPAGGQERHAAALAELMAAPSRVLEPAPGGALA